MEQHRCNPGCDNRFARTIHNWTDAEFDAADIIVTVARTGRTGWDAIRRIGGMAEIIVESAPSERAAIAAARRRFSTFPIRRASRGEE